MITKLKHHDSCEVQIIFGLSNYHTAHLECVDPKCKRKSKFVQWLSHETADNLKELGIPSTNLANQFERLNK